MKKVIIGLSLIVLGCMALVIWWSKLIQILLGILPIIFISAGMLVLSAGIRQVENIKIKNKSGIRSIKEKLSQKSSEDKK